MSGHERLLFKTLKVMVFLKENYIYYKLNFIFVVLTILEAIFCKIVKLHAKLQMH